ncbi:MAG: PqiC family protein [Janthinobacterium lividum]
MRRRNLLLLPILLLDGCASSSPDLYSLEPRLGPARAGRHQLVVVRGVGLPRYLEREEIVRVAGGARLRVAENDWWGEPLRAMLRRVLVADLAQRLPGTDVLADEGPVAARPDAEVELDVQRFDPGPGGPMVFEGYAAVTGRGRQRNLERLHIEVPVSADTTKAQVDAMSTALGQVADAVALRLA